jgi:hypothetical protein
MSEDKTAEEIWASFCDEYKHIPKDEMDDETRETMFSSFMDGWRAAEKSQAELERRLSKMTARCTELLDESRERMESNLDVTELERRLGIAVRALEEIRSHKEEVYGKMVDGFVWDMIDIARQALNEIRAKEGDEG